MPDPDPASMFVIHFLLFILMCLITGLFHLGDETITAIGETRLRELEEDGNRYASIARKITTKERRFLTRLRINTLLCGVIAAFAFITAASQLYSLIFSNHGLATPFWVVAVALIISITVLSAFSNMLPRRLVHRHPEKALVFVGAFSFFYHLLYPLYAICRVLTWPIVMIAGMNPNEDLDKVTEDDIIELIEDVEEIGELEESQKDMLNNIFEFDDITAAEIMTPRIDVAAIEADDSLTDALAMVIHNGYSRLPVYEEDVDHIIGLLHMKDLLPYVGRTIPKSVTIRSLLRDTYFVPDTKKCDELFAEMNEKHLQLAIVVDEYGGVAGIVTIEDLLESIVGNMQDEFDHEEEEITKLDDDSFEVDGTLSINELGDILDKEFPEGDYDTVAGFLLDLLGHIPEEDAETVIEYDDLTFTIQEMDDHRIEQVLVCRTPHNITCTDEIG